jgi:integration host factor subunit alpha
MVGTLTRADLAETINRKMGLSRAESLQLVEAVLRHMCHSLSNGENVKISGFGSFILRDKSERVGRNPKTGIEVPISRLLTQEGYTIRGARAAIESGMAAGTSGSVAVPPPAEIGNSPVPDAPLDRNELIARLQNIRSKLVEALS